jgi:hypothetical protein
LALTFRFESVLGAILPDVACFEDLAAHCDIDARLNGLHRAYRQTDIEDRVC